MWRRGVRAGHVPQQRRARTGEGARQRPHKRRRDTVNKCDAERAQERPRHGPGVRVVVPRVQIGHKQRVVRRLRVEGLLDLGEGAGEAVRDRCGREEELPEA